MAEVWKAYKRMRKAANKPGERPETRSEDA
jgi:hypothetical protein